MRCAAVGGWFRIVIALLSLGCENGPTAPTDGSRSALLSARSESASVDRPLIGFEQLAAGDQVAVHFRSDGCFHHFVAEVLLTRVDDGIAVHVIHASANLAPDWHVVFDTTLAMHEVRGLDRLLLFYRSDRQSLCTTVDRVDLHVVHGRQEGLSESYTDGSCGSYEREDLYPIGGLILLAKRSSGRNGA